MGLKLCVQIIPADSILCRPKSDFLYSFEIVLEEFLVAYDSKLECTSDFPCQNPTGSYHYAGKSQ